MKRKTQRRELAAQFYRGNRLTFAVAAFAALTAGSLNLILSWLIQQLIDTASGMPNARPLGALALLSAGMVGLCIAVTLLRYAAEPRFLEKAMRQYRNFAFQKLTEKSIASFRDESTASYLSALTNDTATVEASYLEQQLSVLTQAVTFAGALVIMLWYSPVLTAIAAGLTVLPLIASLMTGKQLQTAERRVSARNRDFTAALSDCLGGFSVVKTFRAEKEIMRLFAENNRRLEREKCTKRRIKMMVGLLAAVTGIIAQLDVFLVGAYFVLTGRGLTAGGVILFVNLMNFMIEPVTTLPALLAGRRAALGLMDQLADALAQHGTAAGQAEPAPLTEGIRMEHVSFSYEPGREVLHDVSTTFEAGKAYAVVGGSGKSTLLNLLMAAGDYQGSIRLDGTELRDVLPESLYAVMSVIQQNVFVFNASIRDNVTMFRAFPQDALDDAIAHAHLTGLLAERGEAYRCGENGVGLSGGEKQRISIARTLLKKSSVLLADEATAALDAKTAHAVTSDLLDLTGMTRIIVTHNLEASALRRFDRILVMKDGRIEETGTFDELMAGKGYFYALFTVSQ